MGKFKLDTDKTVLVVIDIQERLVPVMPQKIYARLRKTVAMLVEAAKLLGIPVVTSEQYPRGIGHTVPELAELCSDKVVEKVSFGCCGEPDFNAAIKESGRSLLAVGVKAVEGDFGRGDVVSCVDERGREVARGLVNYDAQETARIQGQPSTRFEDILGYIDDQELIHRDNLVLM